MAQLVTLQLSPIFSDFRQRVERLRDLILADGRLVLRREWALSVRERFYRTGAGLQSAVDEVTTEGDRKTYSLFPTAFYMIFGEYGTGQRGRATGGPAPAGYRYGPKSGMVARRFSRIAVTAAAPQVEAIAINRARQFARNATIS